MRKGVGLDVDRWALAKCSEERISLNLVPQILARLFNHQKKVLSKREAMNEHNIIAHKESKNNTNF